MSTETTGHILIRRPSDWQVICRVCRAEFWAAGSDPFTSVCGGAS